MISLDVLPCFVDDCKEMAVSWCGWCDYPFCAKHLSENNCCFACLQKEEIQDMRDLMRRIDGTLYPSGLITLPPETTNDQLEGIKKEIIKSFQTRRPSVIDLSRRNSVHLIPLDKPKEE